jgi:hypothetical protein
MPALRHTGEGRMGELLYVVVKVLLIILVGSIPVWVATRRSRAEFRRRFGRTPSDAELDDLGAWLKDPVDKYAYQRQQQPPQPLPQQARQASTEPQTQADAAPPMPRTSFGAGPRA